MSTLQLITHYSTYYLLLTTYCLLLSEYYSLLTTYYLLQGLLFSSSWSALQLPGEEASLVLIQFVHQEATSKGGERLVGWVALPAESCGTHHMQLRAPPLPKTAGEARSPGADLLDCWVHCELAVAITGSFAEAQRKRTPSPTHQVAPTRTVTGTLTPNPKPNPKP